MKPVITFELIVEYKKLCDKFAAGPMKMSFTDSARLTELDATLAMYDKVQFLIVEVLKLREMLRHAGECGHGMLVMQIEKLEKQLQDRLQTE